MLTCGRSRVEISDKCVSMAKYRVQLLLRLYHDLCVGDFMFVDKPLGVRLNFRDIHYFSQVVSRLC